MGLSCNIHYSMQMKEKICLTELLLGRNHGCITTNLSQKCASVQWKHPSSPSTKKFKVMGMPSAGKIMHTMFWDSQGILLAHFQKC
jgi:hypothetical protein